MSWPLAYQAVDIKNDTIYENIRNISESKLITKKPVRRWISECFETEASLVGRLLFSNSSLTMQSLEISSHVSNIEIAKIILYCSTKC